MTDEKMDLAGIIETGKQQARKQLKESAEAVGNAEKVMTNARARRSEVIRTAQGALPNSEIAAILGVTERQVLSWARTEPVKRTRKQTVEVVDGRTGEVVEGERAEVAEIGYVSEGEDPGELFSALDALDEDAQDAAEREAASLQ